MPIIDIEASTPGAGKGLFVDCLHLIFDGTTCPITTISDDEAETRKKITSLLLSGSKIINIDNVKSIDSGQLAAALTSRTWSDRLLGKTLQLNLPNDAIWLLTGNNPIFSAEITRRAIRVRIDTEVEKPWLRKGFKYPNLRDWVLKNRDCLVWAILTLIQNWIAKGHPKGSQILGSFNLWAQTIGGILESAGISGFLDNQAEFYSTSNLEDDDWRAFINFWRESLSGSVYLSELYTLAISNDFIPHALGNGNKQAQLIRLSNELRSRIGRIYDSYMIKREFCSHKKTHRYLLSKIPNTT